MVKKLPRGIYIRRSVYWIRYADSSGTMHYESSHSHSPKDAVALLKKRRAEVVVLPQATPKRAQVGFTMLSARYREWMTLRQKSAEVKGYILNTMERYFDNKPLSQFSTASVEQYQSALIARGLKPVTANKNLAVLKAMFRKALEWEIVSPEVHKAVSAVRHLPDNSRRLRYLTREECERLIGCAERHLQPIIVTAINTGMRKTEILSLRWKQVDLRQGFIYLQDTKNGSPHEVPINKTLRAMLESLTRWTEYVFPNPMTGAPYGSIKRAFATALSRAGIADLHFHDLRHTFASQLVMAGVDITTVKELLNHKSLRMTLRYSHLSQSHKHRAVGVLDG